MQELQERFRRGVGLSQRGHGGLLQHLRFGQIRRFGRDIGVSNLRFRGRLVGDLRLSQTDGVLEIVFAGSDSALDVAERRHRRREVGDGCQGMGLPCRLVSAWMPKAVESTTLVAPLRFTLTWESAWVSPPPMYTSMVVLYWPLVPPALAKPMFAACRSISPSSVVNSVFSVRAVAGEGRRCRLRGQGLELVENVRNIVQSAVNGLENADAIIRVADALREL